MTSDASNAPAGPAPLIGVPHGPDLFATDVTGLELLEGCLGIPLEVVKYDHAQTPAQPSRTMVGRLILPIPAAQRLAVVLYDFLRQRGLDPAAVIATAGDPLRPQ